MRYPRFGSRVLVGVFWEVGAGGWVYGVSGVGENLELSDVLYGLVSFLLREHLLGRAKLLIF